MEEGCNLQDLVKNIASTFNLHESEVQIIQVYNEDWADWIDVEEDEVPPNSSKVLAILKKSPSEYNNNNR